MKIKDLLCKRGGVSRFIPLINFYRLKGTKLKCKKAILLNNKFKCVGLNNEIVINENCYLRNCKINILGSNNYIYIGSNAKLNSAEIWMEDDGNTLKIGNNTRMAGKIHMAIIEGTTLNIGEECLFSSEIIIRTGDSHSILDNNRKRLNDSSSINIGNHVWIGNRSIILKGVSVEHDSIIGSGALITKSFIESNVIIAGIPGKIIKSDINWCKERT